MESAIVNETVMKNKVPQVTLAFWLIKIAATTLGETGGDALFHDPEARLRHE